MDVASLIEKALNKDWYLQIKQILKF
jgi:hypothetical protein